MKKSSVSVILPCFNESETVFGNISKIHQYLQGNFEIFEIIAVNDGSTDSTAHELERARNSFGIRVLDNDINGGKGKAVRDGVLASKYEIVMFMDADMAIPIEELGKFVDNLEEGDDLAIASRFVPGLQILKPVPLHRKLMERVFRIMRMVILNNHAVRDTQCGFKVFRREAAMRIFPMLTVRRFAFDSEIIFLACKMDFKVKELPIILQNPRQSHVRLLRDPLNMASDLLKIRINSLLGKYKY